MKIFYYFQDIEGKWTPAKKEKAIAALRARSNGDGREMTVRFLEPVAQPSKRRPVFFQYEAYAEPEDCRDGDRFAD